jgi:hypothetical protein
VSILIEEVGIVIVRTFNETLDIVHASHVSVLIEEVGIVVLTFLE